MPIIYLAMRNLHSGLGLEDERSDMTELEALRELVAFREHGTLSAAADELRITQPTMTRTMRKLERELGVPLFDRRAKNRLSLTHTGELAAQEAEQLLDAYDRFVETVRNDANLHNEIVVGSVAPGPCIFSSKPASAMPNGNRPSPCGTISLSPAPCSTTCCARRR